MTGEQINGLVAELLGEHALIGIHHPDSRQALGTGKGWPDWVIVGRRILFREVKGHGDRLSTDQRRVAAAILLAGGDWAVWGPGDFGEDGRARRELQAISLRG